MKSDRNKLGRPPIDPDRRQKIVEATLNCIRQFGYHKTTVARICSDSGLSAGYIHYYFSGKQKLLEEAMRSLLRDVRGRMIRNLDGLNSPLERIAAILESNFDPELFHSGICIIWLHFWAQAPHEAELARLEKVNRIRFRHNLIHALSEVLERSAAEKLAHQIVAMVDGFWVEKAQSSTTLSSEFALNAVLDFVRSQLPDA
jgi:TetR/AcrR family transcriptional repressor of bet genes